ncbi:MAG: LysE family translocator [Candidatus Omnitrophota bacterium]
MTLGSMIAMFAAMMVLAVVPDTSAVVVVTRSLSGGLSRGAAVVGGIVAGDIIFIVLAVYGLSAVAQSMSVLLTALKYLGAAYLVWSGLRLWTVKPAAVPLEPGKINPATADFLCGLLITLGDPKAIFFYVSFLPAFLDLTKVSIMDTGCIMLLAATAVTVTKLGYAYMADRARLLFKNPAAIKRMNLAAGGVLIATGVILLLKS